MFNGIIYKTGKIFFIKVNNKSKLIGIKSNLRLKKSDIGSSISCNGVCLTVTKIIKGSIFFYISNETLQRSNFNKIKIGQIINLEKSLVFGQEISGNFIQGHVDTTANVKSINIIGKSWILKLEIENKNYPSF